MNEILPANIRKSGFKYWLEPNGTLFQTDEHSSGARRWAMQNLDDAPMTFGVTDMMKRGWIRLVTEKDVIWVTGGEGATRPELTPSQKKTVRNISDAFLEINGNTPNIRVGDGGKSTPVPGLASSPEFIRKAELSAVPSFYKKNGAVFGDSVRRFVAALMEKR